LSTYYVLPEADDLNTAASDPEENLLLDTCMSLTKSSDTLLHVE